MILLIVWKRLETAGQKVELRLWECYSFTSSNGIDWNFSRIYDENYPESEIYIGKICYSEKLNMFVITSGINLLYSKFVDGENIIDYLTENSDMNFSIAVGKNRLIISGDGNLNIRFKYKQRYLGV